METVVTHHPFNFHQNPIIEMIPLVRSKLLSAFFFIRYFLQPRENGGKSVKVEELGSLRLNIVYTEDHVFPSEHYTPLRDLLLHSANVEVSVHKLLGPISVSHLQNLIPSTALHYTFAPPLFSPCQRPRLTFWGRCAGRNRKRPSPLCVFFFTMARSCLSLARSLTLKSTAHSECLIASFLLQRTQYLSQFS